MGQFLGYADERDPAWPKNSVRHRYAGEPDVPGCTGYFYGDPGAESGNEPATMGLDFFPSQARRLYH